MNVHDTKPGAGKPDETVSIDIEGKTVKLPLRSGTIGPKVVDVSTLYKETGSFTYNPGFTSTANCTSRITFIDGDKGEFYRGYPIDHLQRTPTSWRSAICYYTENCRPTASSSISAAPSPITRWCTSR